MHVTEWDMPGISVILSVPSSLSLCRPEYQYSCGRCSSIWETSSTAMRCPDRPRTASLARPKQTHPLYHPSRQVQTVVRPAAKNCSPSEHTEQLARPKLRHEGPFRDPQWVVSQAALGGVASEKVGELARPKKLAEGYQQSRDVIWRVSLGARNAIASNR